MPTTEAFVGAGDFDSHGVSHFESLTSQNNRIRSMAYSGYSDVGGWRLKVDDAANAFAFMHQVERFVNVFQTHGVGDEIFQRELSGKIVFDNAR